MHDFYKASPKQSPENAHRTLQTSKEVSRELAKTPCVKLHASPRVPQGVAPEMTSGFGQPLAGKQKKTHKHSCHLYPSLLLVGKRGRV